MFNFVAEPSSIGIVRSTVKSACVWLFSRPEPVAARPARSDRHFRPKQAALASSARLSMAEQWDRLASVLVVSNGQASHARDLQGRASQQIDLATYAFNSIIDELALVMALPARRELAVVHLFEPALARSKERGAIAAYRAA